MGAKYDKGEGIKKDISEAAKWYRKAAEQGHVSAQFNLGVMYFQGEGVAQNKALAKKWFQRAAAQNDEKNAKVIQNAKGVLRDYF